MYIFIVAAANIEDMAAVLKKRQEDQYLNMQIDVSIYFCVPESCGSIFSCAQSKNFLVSGFPIKLFVAHQLTSFLVTCNRGSFYQQP